MPNLWTSTPFHGDVWRGGQFFWSTVAGDRPKWNLRCHTNICDGEIDRDALHRAEAKLLQLKQRRFLKELETGHRIFVSKSNTPPPAADMRELLANLRRYGSNWLLRVAASDPDHPPGLAQNAGGGLLRAPYEDATAIDPDSWHAMCRNAFAVAYKLPHVIQPDIKHGGTMGEPPQR
jgi:hypothetical protein